jgi:hypothetical protein
MFQLKGRRRSRRKRVGQQMGMQLGMGKKQTREMIQGTGRIPSKDSKAQAVESLLGTMYGAIIVLGRAQMSQCVGSTLSGNGLSSRV